MATDKVHLVIDNPLLIPLLVMQAFALEPLAGLFAFQLAEGLESKQASAAGAGIAKDVAKGGTWYCFTLSVARALRVTTRAVAQSVSRHCSAAEATSVLCLKRSDLSAAAFARLLSTYTAVKQQLDGAVDSLHSRKGDKFNIYPVSLVAKLLALHSPSKVDATTLETVRTFAQKQQQKQASQQLFFAAASAEHSVAMDLDDASVPPLEAAAGMGPGLGLGLGSVAAAQSFPERKDQASLASLAAGVAETKVKLEPGLGSSSSNRHRSLPVSSFLGGIPVIDLTHPATLAALSRLDDDADSKEQADTATADVEQTLSSLLDNFSLWHPLVEEYAVLREYGMRPQEVSVLLQEQCQRFSEYRQEIWNWHRDPNQVTPRTVGNNIRVFLLFGGFVCHSAKRHRLKPAAFDMSVFGSKHIEPYIMDFLQYLHGSRKLMFSSIANYLNSLVVLAKFYFVDNPLADLSFTAERVDTEYVLAGLRRVRAQTNAKAKSELLQKPLHAQWLSWPECQQVRRACQAAYDAAAAAGGNNDKSAKRLLKSLVCLMFYTIAPPPRCSIVRLLQWRTTLVKKRADPSRYVIDLLNNPEAAASQHKTVKFYRRAVLPLPKSMTPYLDKLRKQRRRGPGDWVFVNSHGEPYSSSAWTHFVKATFRKHSPGDKKKAPSASLARSIFVTWLNGVPYDTRDSPFLQEMKLTAAEYQTHSLAIANNHYDKDAASEAKLRVLVDFCDAYAQWQPDPASAAPVAAAAGAGGAAPGGKEAKMAAKLSENLDSDDEDNDSDAKERSSSPPAGHAAAAASVLGDKTDSGLADMQLGNDVDDLAEARDSAASAAAGSGSGAGSSSIPATSPVHAASAVAETKLARTAKVKACAALQRSTGAGAAAAGGAALSENKGAAGSSSKKQKRAPRKARKARDLSDDSGSESESSSSSASSSSSEHDSDEEDAAMPDEAEYLPDRIVAKKTVQWKDFYLVHWLGFTAAERTWEPAAFFDQYCTKQTYEYQQARRPLRILAQRSHPRRSSESKRGAASPASASSASSTLFYEVQWHGQSETTMEVAAEMLKQYSEVVKDWETREAERTSRKRKQRPEGLGGDPTQPTPQAAKAAGEPSAQKSRRVGS